MTIAFTTDMNRNKYLGRTATTPRPDPATYRGPHSAIEREQAQWDQAKAWDDQNAQLRADRTAAVDRKREEASKQIADEADARFVDGLRKNYFRADPGATEADFAKDLSEIRRQLRLQAATVPQPDINAGAYRPL